MLRLGGQMLKIYNGWAFEEDENKKRDINANTFIKLIDRCKVGYGEDNGSAEYFVFNGEYLETKECELNELEVAFKHLPPTYNEIHAQVIVNKPRFNNDELLLLFDRGNLCFGGTVSNNILTVFTD